MAARIHQPSPAFTFPGTMPQRNFWVILSWLALQLAFSGAFRGLMAQANFAEGWSFLQPALDLDPSLQAFCAIGLW